MQSMSVKKIHGIFMNFSFPHLTDRRLLTQGMASSSSSGRTQRTDCDIIIDVCIGMKQQSSQQEAFAHMPGSCVPSFELSVFYVLLQPPSEQSRVLKQDLSKYKSMNTTQVEAALKGSTYLTKWVD